MQTFSNNVVFLLVSKKQINYFMVFFKVKHKRQMTDRQSDNDKTKLIIKLYLYPCNAIHYVFVYYKENHGR